MTAPIGLSLKRREDRRLLTGRGRFVDDVRLPDLVHAAIVRSPHAHARIVNVDARRARAFPGVVAVLTIADLPECVAAVPPLVATPRFRAYTQPAIAGPKVRHAGEAVAVVVTDDAYGAADAADALDVQYAVLPPAATSRRRSRRARRGSSTNGPTTSRARRRPRSAT
jgi:carbon-monoxide dehydrogenase large subunit